MKFFSQSQIDEVSAEISQGAVVAVPTETVYGLAIKYDSPRAVQKLIEIKDRSADSGKVFTLMLSDVAQISEFAVEDDLSLRLSQDHFPGELTLIMNKNPKFKNIYFDQFDTIGIRVPNHSFMSRLLDASGPLIVTSANSRGEAPAMTGGEVAKCLSGIDVIVNGSAVGGVPSTVVSVVGGKVNTLRQGNLVVK